MNTLSVIIIAGDVADEILPTLKGAKEFADEIIVVYNGSSGDGTTLKAVKPYATKIYQTNGHDFSKWRNQGAQLATSDWLFYLDSDERVTPALAEEIKKVINTSEFSAYEISRFEIFLGKHLSHWGDPWVLRLIKKDKLDKWVGKLHEQPKISGPIGKLKNQMVHLSHKNIDEKVANTLNWSKLEADMLLEAKHPQMVGWRFIRIILTEFSYRFFKQKLFMDGTEGMIEVIYQMFSRFITYVRLWEAQRKPSLKESYQKIDQQILDQWKQKTK
mgnify:CR=1 FL=1